MMRLGWRWIPVTIFLVLSVFLWRGLSLNPHHLPSAQIGQKIPDFNLPELFHPDSNFSPLQLPHRPVLLNVWASWCQACIEEQVLMMQLAREGVLIYGLNYKDDPVAAKAWLEQWGNPYQRIGLDDTGKIAIDFGVYGAPETFVLDASGIIRYRHAGALNRKIWLKQIQPLMAQLGRNL